MLLMCEEIGNDFCDVFLILLVDFGCDVHCSCADRKEREAAMILQ